MNGDAHTNIFKGAIEALPEKYQTKLTSHQALFDKVGNYPDYFDDPTRSENVKLEIDPEWRTYCEFPPHMAGRTLHHWPCPISDGPGRRPLLEYFLGKMLESYRANDLVGFIKFSGCLSHFFGDSTQAAHLDYDISCKFISELLPKPNNDEFGDFHYHTSIEKVTGRCEALSAPSLQGTSVAETCWRLGTRCQESIVYCRRFIVPIVQALFAQDMEKAIEAATPAVTIAAQLTADAIVSIIKIAKNDFSEKEVAELGIVDLRTLKPDAEKHDLVYGGAVLDGNKEVPPNNAPVTPAVLINEGGKKVFVKGLGVLPQSGMCGDREVWMRYDLPEKVFKTFSTTIGMHAELAVGGAVEFIVEQDGEITYKSGRVTQSDKVKKIEIDVSETSQLLLKVIDANDGKSFWKNHAFWGEPTLRK